MGTLAWGHRHKTRDRERRWYVERRGSRAQRRRRTAALGVQKAGGVMLERGFDPAFKDLLVLESFLFQDGEGQPTCGPAGEVRGRVQAEVPKETNAPSEEAATYSTVYLKPLAVTGMRVEPGPRDRLTLPEGHTPRQAPIVSVKRLD